MSFGVKIMLGLLAALIVWFIFKIIKGNPYNSFSKENMSKSLRTLGLMGVGLILFISFLVVLLRGS